LFQLVVVLRALAEIGSPSLEDRPPDPFHPLPVVAESHSRHHHDKPGKRTLAELVIGMDMKKENSALLKRYESALRSHNAIGPTNTPTELVVNNKSGGT
jgi:hypothetical protein